MLRISSAVRNPDAAGNGVLGCCGMMSGESSQARGWTRRRSDRAPVGQEVMHSPHCTQLLSPMRKSRSKLMRALYPLPVWPMTLNGLTSEHDRTHRSHRMHRSWSTTTVRDEYGNFASILRFHTSQAVWAAGSATRPGGSAVVAGGSSTRRDRGDGG